ncbi:MAG: SIMPL domain-containing protein, partial [Propionibacteriaceae bacterium]|nr:SIMPL domain-containing protein [Propionibacteriaceae bacterium]
MQITVIGSHAWSLPPERATVHITVDVEGEERAATSREATAIVDALGRDLHRLRQGSDAPLTWYTVGPLATRSWRPWGPDGQPMATRFGASAILTAKFRDFAALSEVTGGWAEREGVQITRVAWTLTDATRTATEAAALTRAVEEARSRALAIAQAAGWSEVDVLEVADPGLLAGHGGGTPQPAQAGGNLRMMAAKEDSSGGALAPEDVHGEAVVHARFEARR